MAGISLRQACDLEAIERAMSIVSLLGTFFIFWTFARFSYFRKPINRLVMFASIGNLASNVATLIARSGIEAGTGSGLCQFQAFLIQTFMPADILWTFCMALNVFMTFFKNRNAPSLRRLEKWYIVLCYGLPLIPALVFLGLDNSKQSGIFGDATLWCWISPERDWMRLAFFYCPVWLVILVNLTIYTFTGIEILKHRSALRAFSKTPTRPISHVENTSILENGSRVTKITEIQVTSEAIEEVEPVTSFPTSTIQVSSDAASLMSFSNLQEASNSQSASKRTSQGKTDALEKSNANPESSGHLADLTTKEGVHCHGRNVNCTATVTTGQSNKNDETADRGARSGRKVGSRNPAMRANRAAWAYAKVALLMFISTFIVWVPSTFNRLYAIIEPDKPVFALNILAATVLPTQGFWNFAIYVCTSWSQCKAAWSHIKVDLRRVFHETPKRPGEGSEPTTGTPRRRIRRGSGDMTEIDLGSDVDDEVDKAQSKEEGAGPSLRASDELNPSCHSAAPDEPIIKTVSHNVSIPYSPSSHELRKLSSTSCV